MSRYGLEIWSCCLGAGGYDPDEGRVGVACLSKLDLAFQVHDQNTFEEFLVRNALKRAAQQILKSAVNEEMKDGRGAEFTKKSHHKGAFDGYSLIGVQYTFDGLHDAWHITAYPIQYGAPINQYWVQDGEFREMSIHFAHPALNRNLIEAFGIAENIRPDEKGAIIHALDEWEKLEREKLLKDFV